MDEATEGQQETQPTAEQEREQIMAGFEGRTTATPSEPEAPAEEKPAEPPAPKYAQITEDDYKSLLAKASRVDEIEALHKRDRDAIYGTIGGLQRSVNARQTVKLPPKEKLDAIRADLPEVAELFDAIEVAQGQPAIDQDQLAQAAQERLKPELERVKQEALTHARNELRAELLADQHPDWREVANGQEFAAYAKAQGAEFMTKLAKASEDWDHRFIGKAITSFKASKTQAHDNANDRRSDLAAAVNPRGTAAPAPAGKTEAEQIMAGFNRSRGGR